MSNGVHVAERWDVKRAAPGYTAWIKEMILGEEGYALNALGILAAGQKWFDDPARTEIDAYTIFWNSPLPVRLDTPQTGLIRALYIGWYLRKPEHRLEDGKLLYPDRLRRDPCTAPLTILQGEIPPPPELVALPTLEELRTRSRPAIALTASYVTLQRPTADAGFLLGRANPTSGERLEIDFDTAELREKYPYPPPPPQGLHRSQSDGDLGYD
jgi:hypothetical protein